MPSDSSGTARRRAHPLRMILLFTAAGGIGAAAYFLPAVGAAIATGLAIFVALAELTRGR